MRFTQSPSLSRGNDERNFAPRDLDDGEEFADERSETGEPISDSRLRWPRAESSRRGRSASRKPSVVRRMFRAVGRFFVAMLIGVGATLSWQAYGDDAREMVITRAPSLAWLVPASSARSAGPTASSPNLAQQLQPMTLDVALVRRQIEQLSVDQQQLGANEVQIADSVARLQATEQDVSQKLASIIESRTGHLRPRASAQRAVQSSSLH